MKYQRPKKPLMNRCQFNQLKIQRVLPRLAHHQVTENKLDTFAYILSDIIKYLFENINYIKIVLNEEMDRPENKIGQGETTMRSDEATLLSLSNVESTSSTSESLTTKTTTSKNF